MAERAQTTARTAQAGKKAADETGTLIGRLKDEMATVAATMVTLSEQSQAIGQIIATVDDLEAIAADDAAEVPALTGWRRELFGETALKLKRGGIALAVDHNHVVAIER